MKPGNRRRHGAKSFGFGRQIRFGDALVRDRRVFMGRGRL